MTDKKYPRPGTPVQGIQSGEDRDIQGFKAKKSRDTPQSDQIKTIFDEPTKPTQMVQARIDDDPAFAFLWNRVSRMKQELLGTTATTANTALEALHVAGIDKQTVDRVDDNESAVEKIFTRLDKVESEVDKMATVMGIMKWIAGFVIATVLGSVIVIATKIYAWGENSGTIEMRMKYVEKQAESNSNRIDRLGGGGRRDFMMTQPPADSKGTTTP